MNQQFLKQYLLYDQQTGAFTWAKASGGKPAGASAGFVQRNGRHAIGLLGRTYQAHRLAWLYVHGVWPRDMVDHINGDPLDNRIANLREADNALNMQNQRRPNRANKSGYLGVCFNKRAGKWQAAIGVEKKVRYLGLYQSPEAAHQAYLTAKRELHPGGML